MRPAERQQYSSTARPGQRGQDSVLRNWTPRGTILRYKIGAIRWEHRGCRSGKACESSSEKKLVLIAVLRSNVGNESLLLYQIRKGAAAYWEVHIHASSQALAPVIVVVIWPPMHEIWRPVLADGLPQRRRSYTASVDKQRTRG